MPDTISIGKRPPINGHANHQLASVDTLTSVKLDGGIDRVSTGLVGKQVGLVTSDLVPGASKLAYQPSALARTDTPITVQLTS